jgi:hypothetical protein
MNNKQKCNNGCVTEKEILTLSWNYFQQHAQQRLSLFNFFVVFASLMTTGLISTFQTKYEIHFIGIGVGLVLAFISFIFWKIDERNCHFAVQLTPPICRSIDPLSP